MSTVAPIHPEAGATRAPALGFVTQARVIRSEWTKLWTLRSTRYSLLAAVLGMVLMPVAIAVFTMTQWAQLSPHDRELDAINTPSADTSWPSSPSASSACSSSPASTPPA
jgi:ABC-2 type transport system permease protein